MLSPLFNELVSGSRILLLLILDAVGSLNTNVNIYTIPCKRCEMSKFREIASGFLKKLTYIQRWVKACYVISTFISTVLKCMGSVLRFLKIDNF